MQSSDAKLPAAMLHVLCSKLTGLSGGKVRLVTVLLDRPIILILK